ncbi:MAG TPA: ABC transporter permease [Candidatus Brocadiia bacterium]|nr:ABC transporter permease [Candidatus Brocadiia bacterium]
MSSGAGLSGRVLAIRSAAYFLWSNLAVALGVVAASAAIIGSLLVGHSVRMSLRDIALERLGAVEYAVSPGFFFDRAITESESAVGIISVTGTARSSETEASAPRINAIAVGPDFSRLGPGAQEIRPAGRECVINSLLAADLGLKVGDAIILGIPRRGLAPAASLFGRRSPGDVLLSVRLTVARVITSAGIGRFTLKGDQPNPRNVYVSLDLLQERLEAAGRINMLLFVKTEGANPGRELKIEPQTIGLGISADERNHGITLRSRTIIFSDAVLRTAESAAESCGMKAFPISVYLANSIEVTGGGKSSGGIPYSIIVGIDPAQVSAEGEIPVEARNAGNLGDDAILLNEWAAEDLACKPGDRIRIAYYQVGPSGEPAETEAFFTFKGVVPMDGIGGDASLVPEFDGMTDAEALNDWKPPFPINFKRIRDKDEEYWRRYRAAPKAILSPSALRRMWQPDGRGEGWVTSLRLLPVDGRDSSVAIKDFVDAFRKVAMPDELGFTLQPVRRIALESSTGSSDFGMLFVSLSMFLVAAAVFLVGLLLRLNIERRARHYGILSAVGIPAKVSMRILYGEALAVSVAGVLAGIVFGAVYAWALIKALGSWWVGAVGEYALSFHFGGFQTALGAAIGLAVSWAGIAWACRGLRRADALVLLGGWQSKSVADSAGSPRGWFIAGGCAETLGALLVALSVSTEVISQTVAFFIAGALLLAGLLAAFGGVLTLRPVASGAVNLPLLAWKGVSLNRSRSLLTTALVSCAVFVIVATAANRKNLSGLDVFRRDSGAGGFNLLARTSVPIFHDLGTKEGWASLAFDQDGLDALAGCEIVSLRVSDGDDVSCLNIQKPAQPRIIGIPPRLRAMNAFSFAGVRDTLQRAPGAHDAEFENFDNPWDILLSGDEQPPAWSSGTLIPAVADAASAQWILHKRMGDTVAAGNGDEVGLTISGLLKPSVFAGSLLISEENFIRHFGAEDGFREFLIRTPPGQAGKVALALRRNLGDMGLEVLTTNEVLVGYARVQNTYLATFQVLGGLGLLLGTFGVVVVLLRGVVERRSELAMLLALGLRRRQAAATIVLENGFLMIVGMAAGASAALVAVIPHAASSLSEVNWLSLGLSIGVCLAFGLAACHSAAHFAVGSDLLPSLRSE